MARTPKSTTSKGKRVLSPLKGGGAVAGKDTAEAKQLKRKGKAGNKPGNPVNSTTTGETAPKVDTKADATKGAKGAKTATAKGKSQTSARTKAGTRKPAGKARKAAIDQPGIERPKPVKYDKKFIGIARRMFLAKITDEDIADVIGIDVEELEWWKEEHPEFGAAFRPDPKDYGGRPTLYEEKFADQAKMLATLGATDLEISQFFNVSLRTIHRWKIEHEEFREALEIGKDEADAKVEESLYRRAVGYTFDSEKILVVEGEVQRVETMEHVPPDVKAATFWLQNRRPGIWRDTKHLKHGVQEDNPLADFLKEISGQAIAPKDHHGPASTEPRAFGPRDDGEQDPEDGV
ncbi:hypothetical protein [Ciceribacter sp. L1K22]|uniref:hypothetical protein n=1 Tax=Ciceribacter sp. L1K22 TaxID=2820275 RepID=UPI001ABE6AA2|nr:hypothetical protein [Ciceribacter sp. L1K22]MBO3760370.1 hypothetical protein [Ciceribacter sp. L1K22]